MLDCSSKACLFEPLKETRIARQTKRTMGKKRWLMASQMLEYFGNNETVVRAIVTGKKKDSAQWRPNPNCPECPEAVQYKVVVEEGEEWDEEDIDESATTFTGE
eukprot:1236055-Alexandrium_andersonii.AAC.1